MRLLFLAPDITLRLEMNGGAGTHMRASINELKDRGYKVTPIIGGDIFNKKISKFPKSSSKLKFFKTILKSITPSELIKTIADFKLILNNKKIKNYILKNYKAQDFDVIYERSGYGYDVGTFISNAFNRPHILETDVIMLDLKKSYTSKIFNRILYRLLEKKKYHSADSIVVQSEYSVKYCKEYWGLNHNRIYNKDLGVYIDSKKNDLQEIKIIKEKLNLQNKIIVGFVGYFMPYQNIDLLLKVAKDFKSNEKIVFLLVGGGRLLEKFKNFKYKNKLDNLIFTGLVDKSRVSNFYEIIDLGIIPNCAFHMYPVKFLEYVVNDLPVLIPNYEVFKEFFKNDSEFNEFTFIPNNKDSLIKKLNYLIFNIEKLKSKMIYTKKYVTANKTWTNSGSKLENIIIKTVDFENSSHK